MSKVYEGQLEVDHDRGVIYFHLGRRSDMKQLNAVTLLRICGLETPMSKGPWDIALHRKLK
jgi:hypothetical protein